MVEMDLVVNLVVEVDLRNDVNLSPMNLDLWKLEVASSDEINLNRSDSDNTPNVLDWSDVELDSDFSEASLNVNSLDGNGGSLNLVLDLDDDSLWHVSNDSS